MALIGLVSLFNGCSTPSRQGGRPEIPAQDQALEQARRARTPDARQYETMDGLYRSKNYDKALEVGKTFAKSYPKSPFIDQVYNLRGLCYIGQKQFQFALFQLKKAVEIARTEGLRNMASYNLAYTYFELGQTDHAGEALGSIHSSNLERTDRVKFFILRAKIARLRQDSLGSASDILSAIQDTDMRGSGQMESMLNFLDEVLEPISSPVVLERLLGEFESSPAADYLLYRLGNRYLSSGELERAKGLFSRIANDYPRSRYFLAAQENLRRIESQGVVDSRRIGVLLTLSGKFGKFGYKALQGIELALKVFQPPHETNPITLVVMDDKGEPDTAQAALDTLFFKHHVAAVVGPLISKLADPVGKRAQELGVPLIALTQKEASGGNFVFNAALTSTMQVQELMRYATEKAGVRRFAILSPNGKFGDEYVKAFWDEADRTGCAVHGFESYPSDETDFRAYVDRLVGLSETDARSREVEELRLLKAATPVKGRSKKFDRMFTLKPIVDFEAVFIPDDPKALGQILPTFAYRDVEKILFLGINTWDTQELIARAGQFAEGAVFVDGFYAGSQAPTSRRFIEEYHATFNTEPGLVEAMSYDAAHVLASLLRQGELHNRDEMRDRIVALRDFPGVSGRISYREGRLTKRLVLLTVHSGKIEEIAFQ